jgi:hypothetical protein
MVGAVAGSPGTLPTNWSVNTGTGLTQTVVGIGTENGVPYIDLRYNGTAIGTANQISFEASNFIAATNNQAWAGSFWFKIISAPTPPTSYVIRFREATAAGTFVAEGSQAFTPTATLQRFTYVRTNTGATTERIQPMIQLGQVNGATYDYTIRIAAPQMELGAYATTFIPTTTAAVTRLADAASKTGVSSLIGQTEGTVFVDAYFSVTAAGRFFAISDGTIENRILFLRNANNSVTLLVTTSTVVEASITTGILSNGSHRFGVSYANNAFSLYVDGTLIGTDTSGTVPACSVIYVGNEINGNFFGDSIAQAALFTRRLTNAELAQITT